MSKGVSKHTITMPQFPGGRTPEDGPESGQEWAEKLKALLVGQEDWTVRLDFSLCRGVPPSFIDAFLGELVRECALRFSDFLYCPKIQIDGLNFNARMMVFDIIRKAELQRTSPHAKP